MKYIIDSYIWTEYFMGTKAAEKAKKYKTKPKSMSNR